MLTEVLIWKQHNIPMKQEKNLKWGKINKNFPQSKKGSFTSVVTTHSSNSKSIFAESQTLIKVLLQ